MQARNAATIINEEVGSSDGTPGQSFKLRFTPLLARDKNRDYLSVLTPGDRIEKWTEVADFAAESDRIYRETGPSGLVLMTCGDWNGTRFETTVITYAKAVGRE